MNLCNDSSMCTNLLLLHQYRYIKYVFPPIKGGVNCKGYVNYTVKHDISFFLCFCVFLYVSEFECMCVCVCVCVYVCVCVCEVFM